MHWRIKRVRGRARAYPCHREWCPNRATDWAWDHTGPVVYDEVVSFGQPRRIPFSLDPARYIPLCKAHHVSFDMGGTEPFPCGHERTDENTYHRPGTLPGITNGYCRTCHRNRERERHAQGRTTPHRVARARRAEQAHLASGGTPLFDVA